MSSRYSTPLELADREVTGARPRSRANARVAGLLVLFWAGVLLYSLAIWNDWLPWLRGWRNYPEGWTWASYMAPAERFLPLFVVIAAIGLTYAIFGPGRFARLRIRSASASYRLSSAAFLVIMVVLGYFLQLSLLGLKSENPNKVLVERVTDRVVTGYFTVATQTDRLDTFFSNYPWVFTTRYCPHCHNHPPGGGIFYWLNIQAASLLPGEWRHSLANGAWSLLGDGSSMADLRGKLTDAQMLGAFVGGSLVLLLASMVVIPLFGLARRLGPPGYEFRLAALGLALPGLVLMSPQFDQILATIFAAALYLALRGLAAVGLRESALWAATAGLAGVVGLYFSWSFTAALMALAALGFVCLAVPKQLLLAREIRESRVDRRHVIAWFGGLLAGVAIPLAMLIFLAGTDLVYILNYNLQNGLRTEAARPYFIWLFHGPLDFLQFLGLPLALMTLAAVVVRPPERVSDAARTHRYDNSAHSYPQSGWQFRLNAYAIIFWLTLTAIDLAGRSKAETGRTLIFLMPLALAALYLWAGRERRYLGFINQLLVAQLVICVVIGARWWV